MLPFDILERFLFQKLMKHIIFDLRVENGWNECF